MPAAVGARAAAFATGVQSEGVAATAKHFPGLGRASRTTDVAAVTIRATRAQLDADLVPFRALVLAGVGLVMISNATYTALGPEPAVWSPATYRLLRRDLGFAGVTVTDALEAVAASERRGVDDVVLRAAVAGADLLLLAGGERESAAVFDSLLRAAREGRLPRASLERSYGRVLALKQAHRASVILLRPRGRSGSSPLARASAHAKSCPGTTESRGERRRGSVSGTGSE